MTPHPAEPVWLDDEEQRAWRGLLLMTSRLTATMNHHLLATCGLSLADYDVLVPLSESTDARLRVFEIAAELDWEQSRLSHHLARMERRGLVEREECLTDRRGAFVVLTATGRRAIEDAAPAHAELVRRSVFAALSRTQVTTLATVTARVLDRLDAEADGAS